MNVVLAVLLQAGAASGGVSADLEAEARAAMVGKLKDPLSAQFLDLRPGTAGVPGVVCGQVNSKNAYGGYVGFQPFFAHKGQVFIANDADRTVGPHLRNLIDHMCAPKPSGSEAATASP